MLNNMTTIHIQDDSWLIFYYADLFSKTFTDGKPFSDIVKFSILGIHVISDGKEILINYAKYEKWQDTLPEYI